MNWSEAAITLGVALVLGVAVPWVFVRALVPSLEAGPKLTNYRGRQVFLGLGIVWLVWAGCAIVGGAATASAGLTSSIAILTLAGPLALVAFAMGLVDDAYGTGDDRGFKGHLKAMIRGRLTTGGLKLIGVGLACFVVALVLEQVAPWGGAKIDGDMMAAPAVARLVLTSLLAGAAIALTSNFVNLTDLRPGRALKVYSLLALLGALSSGMLLGRAYLAEFGATSAVHLIAAAGLALFALGPVAAVWRYDLSERGMLGDAGANPMGAVAGLLIVAGLPLWGLAAYFVLMLSLNLASERVSFSRLIDNSAPLRWLDSLGRLPNDAEMQDSAKTSPQTETNPE